MTTIHEGPRSVADVVAGLDIHSKAFVDGEYVDARAGETFDDVSPVTGETIARIAACDAADVDRAVQGRAPRSSRASGRGSRRRSARRRSSVSRR